MEFINQILPTDILHALGWTVIHSLWQAFAVALLLAAYLLALQKTDAQKRYVAGNMALAAIMLLSVATFAFYLRKTVAEPFFENSIFFLFNNTNISMIMSIQDTKAYYICKRKKKNTTHHVMWEKKFI